MSIQILPLLPRKNSKKILQFPNPMLVSTSTPVYKFNKEVIEITNKLLEVLQEVDAIYIRWLGMAAPQIGYNKRIIALKENYHQYKVMINPEVLEKKWHYPSLSTCYSLKGLYLLKRYFWYKIKYQDISGNEHVEIIKGRKATVLNQELDHIDGKLICEL